MSRAYYGIQTGAAFFQGMMDAFNRATAMQADIAKFEKQMALHNQEFALRKEAMEWNKQSDLRRFDLAEREQAFRQETAKRQLEMEQERLGLAKQDSEWRKTESSAQIASKLLEAQNNALLTLQLTRQAYDQKKDVLLRQYQAAEAYGDVKAQAAAKSDLDALEAQWNAERAKIQQAVELAGQQANVYRQAFPSSPVFNALPVGGGLDMSVPSVLPARPSSSAQSAEPAGKAIPYQPGQTAAGASPAPRVNAALPETARAMINPKTGSEIVFAQNQVYAPFEGNLVIDRNGTIYNENGTPVGEYADYIKKSVLDKRKDLISAINTPEFRKPFIQKASKTLHQMVVAGHETSVDPEQFAQAAASKVYDMAASLLQRKANEAGAPLMPHEHEILNDYVRELTLEAIDKTDYGSVISPERKRFRDMIKEYAEKNTLPGGMLLTSDLQGKPLAVRAQPTGLPAGARSDALSRFVYDDFEKHAPGWFKGWKTSQRADWLNINAPTPAKYNDYLHQFRRRLTDYLDKNPMAAQAAAQRITVVEDGQLRPAAWGKDNDEILYYAETLLRQKFLTEGQAPNAFFGTGKIKK